ncbi:DHHA1 domain-containing protein, partial [Fluviicola sp.]|uniref:DHH family phosphoesterase n=1 Tax=Fluviicola sp. TaxID=1917219 RepID=UPI00262B1CB1
PADFCQQVISDTSASSTCELVYKWVKEIGHLDDLDEISGAAIYLGIMTDTGSFRFPSVSAFTHEAIGDLIRRGVKHFLIHEAVYDTNTVDRIKLRGFALSEKLVCLNDMHVGYASLSEAELNRFHYQKGDTEGLVNQILGIQGIKMAVLFVEKEGKVKISFRSKGDYYVNELAKTHFDGGGHAYASGGISSETLEKTVEKFVTFVKDFIPKA